MTPGSHRAPETVTQLIEERLRRSGLRYTGGRRAIVDLLIEAEQPVSISDIAAALPALPRSSAYRHLVDLQRASVVQRVDARDEFVRFELAEDLTGHHHHLVCITCGSVVDIPSDAAFERRVAAHLDGVAAAQGFVTHGHRVDAFGACAACSRPGRVGTPS